MVVIAVRRPAGGFEQQPGFDGGGGLAAVTGAVAGVVGTGVVGPFPGPGGAVVPDREAGDLLDEAGAGGELAAAQQGPGQYPEPQFGHVQPRGMPGREGDRNPGMGGYPGAGGPGGVRRPVVYDQVNVQALVDALVQPVQETGEGDRVVPGDRLGDHLPGGDLAATMETVPLRTYSNSRLASRLRCAGRSGYLRYLAWIPVFSSMQITTVPGGGRR